MIDVLKTRLSSTVSNWYTDADGNLILESVNGTSAMKLCGEGFMIASARTDDGAWDWRTWLEAALQLRHWRRFYR